MTADVVCRITVICRPLVAESRGVRFRPGGDAGHREAALRRPNCEGRVAPPS